MYGTIYTAGAGLPPDGGNFKKARAQNIIPIRIRTRVAYMGKNPK